MVTLHRFKIVINRMFWEFGRWSHWTGCLNLELVTAPYFTAPCLGDVNEILSFQASMPIEIHVVAMLYICGTEGGFHDLVAMLYICRT